MMNEKLIEQNPQIIEQLLQIQIEHSIIVMELEEKLQKYSPPGLNHPAFWQKEREAIENYQKLTNYKF